MREEDAELGLIALEKGLVSQDSLNDCLTALADDGGRTLVDLFKEKSLLSPQQIDSLRQEALRRIKARQTVTLSPEEAAAIPEPVEDAGQVPAPSHSATTEVGAVSAAIPAEATRAFQDPKRQVTAVDVSPDLRNATAFVMPLGGHDEVRLLAAVRRAAPWFRARVGERAGLRHAPEIRFEIDRTFDQADRIGALLRRPDVARDIKDE